MAKVNPAICCGGLPHGSVNQEIDCLKRALIESRRDRDELSRRLMVAYGESK